MKNRIIAAVLSLLIGAPLYLLAAHAAPAQPVSGEAPAELTAFLHSVPAAAERMRTSPGARSSALCPTAPTA